MECCCYTTLILVILVYKFLDWFIRLFYIGRYNERYIFITGCDSGFGNGIAKRLDAKGCHVFAGCFTEKGETELKKTSSNRLQTISLDVSKPESVRRALETVKSLLPPGKGLKKEYLAFGYNQTDIIYERVMLWGVLNNAGIRGASGIMETLTIDDYKTTASVNLYGHIDVSMTFLPLIKASQGRVVNTSSCIGRVTFPGLSAYCVSKYGIESFTDGLRRTLYPFNCKAILIEPGTFTTGLSTRESFDSCFMPAWERADPKIKEEYGEKYFHHITSDAFDALESLSCKSLDKVLDAYEHALLGRFPRARYMPGRDAKFIYLPIQWLPEWLGDWVLRKLDPNLPLPAVLLKKKQ